MNAIISKSANNISCSIKSTVFYLLLLHLAFLVVAIEAKALSDTKPQSLYQTTQNELLPYKQILLLGIDHSDSLSERVFKKEAYDNKREYSGYFDSVKQYRYDQIQKSFVQDPTLKRGDSLAWDGGFLNWLLMRQQDMLSYFLYGNSTYFLHGNEEFKSFNTNQSSELLNSGKSKDVSPLPDNSTLEFKPGLLKVEGQDFSLRLALKGEEFGLISLLPKEIALYLYQTNSDVRPAFERLELDELNSDQFLEELAKAATRSDSKKKTNQKKWIVKNEALIKTLEKIKQDLVSGDVQNLKSNCQHYVHLMISSNENKQSSVPPKEINDCQPGLAGDQLMRQFQLWLDGGVKTNATSIFNANQLTQLKHTLLIALSENQAQPDYRSTGMASQGFEGGQGILYEAGFVNLSNADHIHLNGAGELNALWLDEDGNLRSDNGDKKLGSLKDDPIISSCWDEQEAITRYQLNGSKILDEDCNQLNYPFSRRDLGYLWQASDMLAGIVRTNVAEQRPFYQRIDQRRLIQGNLAQETYDFTDEGHPLTPALLNVYSKDDLKSLINYTRGERQPLTRVRHIEDRDYLLGDSIGSEPMLVAEPNSSFQHISAYEGYTTFYQQYQSRRSRVFLISNDGIIHSFNAGRFNQESQKLSKAPDGATEWPLGYELWAFVPAASLPYLKVFKDRYYGVTVQHHLNLGGESPYIFDAKIFNQQAVQGQADRLFHDSEGKLISRETHPEGWGTLMLAGAGKDKRHYLLFDITDAEQAPVLLAEYLSDDELRLTGQSTLFTKSSGKDELNWYLALGAQKSNRNRNSSGLSFNEAGLVFIHLNELKGIKSTSDTPMFRHSYYDLSHATSIVKGLAGADWDLNGETDTLYVVSSGLSHVSQGAKHKEVSEDSGRLTRVKLQNADFTKGALRSETLINLDSPLVGMPQLSKDPMDNRWIYLATNSKALQGNSVTQHVSPRNRILGFKEPANVSGSIGLSNLLDVSTVEVDAQTGALYGQLSLNPPLSEQNVRALEARMLETEEAKNYVPGWVRTLNPGERARGQSKLLGGMLNQISTRYSLENTCEFNTDTFVYHLRYTTGTAWISAGMNQDDPLSTKNSGLLNNPANARQAQSGVLNESLILHRGEKVSLLNTLGSEQSQQLLSDQIMQDKTREISWKLLN